MSHPFRTIVRRLRTPLLVLLVVYSISIIGYMLIPGVDDQGQPWKMSFLSRLLLCQFHEHHDWFW